MLLKSVVLLIAVATVVFAATTVVKVSSADTNIDPYGGTSPTVPKFYLYRGVRIPLMRFDFSDVPSDAYILSAQLNITWASWTTDFGNLDMKVYKFLVQDVWTEFNEGATWASSGITDWAAPGLQDKVDRNTVLNRDFNLDLFVGNWTSIEVKESIQKSLQNGRTWAGFMFSSYSYSGEIYARESNYAPTLTITWAQNVPQASLPVITVKDRDSWSPGGTITIDSAGSVIPVGTTPTYTWTLMEAPPGSSHTAGETVGNDATLTLTCDAYGFYHLRLRIAKSDDADAYTEADGYVQVGIKTERPRVHISREYAQTKIKGADLTSPPWSYVQNQANAGGYWFFAYSDIYTYMLMWQATGDSSWCQKAWDLSIKPVMFVNGDPNQGYQKLINKYYGDEHQTAFTGGQFLGNFPVALDWGYDCLSSEQKTHIINWVHQEAEYMLTNSYYETYLRNDGLIVVGAIGRAFAALYGTDPNANRFAELFIKGWQKVKHTWERTGKGGTSGEGNGYGHSTAEFLILNAHAMWTATGEDVFEEIDFFKKKLIYDAFALWPRQFSGPNDPFPGVPFGYPLWEMSAIGGDGRRSVGWISIAIRPVAQGLLTRYKDTEEGQAFMHLTGNPTPAEWDLHEIIYPVDRPTTPPPAPTKLSHYAEGMGFVYVRSDWTPDATWFAFWAGPHVDLHQHLDQGAFNIYKRRDLAIKSGSYDSGSATQDHSVAYYTRTISANGILIIDPEEQFNQFIGGRGCLYNRDTNSDAVHYTLNNGYCPPNDGGQRTCSPLAMSVETVDDWLDNYYIYNTAEVTSYYDFEGVVSIASDLTNAYNNPTYSTTFNKPKVTLVLRKVLYIRDLDIFLVGDIINSTNPSFVKKTLLHALQSIIIDTDANSVVQNEGRGIDRYRNVKSGKIIMDDSEPSNPGQTTYDLRWGNSTLLFETVFPEKFSYRLVGGRTPAEGSFADFWVDDYAQEAYPNQPRASTNYPVQYAIESNTQAYDATYGKGYGRYRLEVEAETNRNMDYFLNLYRPTIDGINNQIPSYTKFEDGEFFGVVITGENGKQYAAKFPKNGDAPFVGDAPPNIPVAVPPGNNAPGKNTPGSSPKPTVSGANSVIAMAQVFVCLATLLF